MDQQQNQQNQQPDIQQAPSKNPWESFTEQQEAEFQNWSKGLKEDYYNTDRGRRELGRGLKPATREERLNKAKQDNTADFDEEYWNMDYDEWGQNELDVLNNSIIPDSLSASYGRENSDVLKQEVQDVLNDPNNVMDGKTDFGKSVRSRYLDQLMNSFYSEGRGSWNLANEIYSIPQLYQVITTTEDPERKEAAIKRLNKSHKKLDAFFRRLTKDEVDNVRKGLLLTEYAQTYEDLKKYPDDLDIWIVPSDYGTQPTVYSNNKHGGYHMTIGDFKSRMLRLATGRGYVDLPSGYFKTEYKPEDTDIYQFNFSELLKPERYLDMAGLSEQQKKELSDAGLTTFYQPDVGQRIEGLAKDVRSGFLGTQEALWELNKQLIDMYRRRDKAEGEERKRIEDQIQKLDRKRLELESELEAEQTAHDKTKEDMVNAQKSAEQEARRVEQVSEVTSMDPDTARLMREMKTQRAKEMERVGNAITEIGNLGSNVISDIDKATLLEKLNKYRENLERLGSAPIHGKADPFIIADELGGIAKAIANNPVLKSIVKGVTVLDLALNLYTTGKDMYDKWKNAEDFYNSLHNQQTFKDYYRTWDDYPEAKTYYDYNMDKHDMAGLWKLQLKDNIPTYGQADITGPQKVLGKLRQSEINLIHAAAQGYNNRTGKDNKYKTSQKEIRQILGVPDNVSDKAVKMLEKDPWILPWIKAGQDTDVLKDVIKTYKNTFQKYRF